LLTAPTPTYEPLGSGADGGWEPARRNPASLLEKIVRLSVSAGAIDIASHETFDGERLFEELVPIVRELLLDTLAFFERILDTYSADADDPESPGPAGEGAERTSGERIADLAFLGRLELRQKMAGLTGLPATADSWRIISAAGSCLRHIQKSLAALEAVIAQTVGIKPVLNSNDDTTQSLAARQAYAGFRRQLREVSRMTDISDRLQGAATCISHLFDLPVYRDLRISDRVQLRRLLERILRWGGPAQHHEAGERIWQDLSACATLLAEISKRQELQEHDERTCQEIRRRLAATPDLPADVRPLLASLAGRDEELDDRLFTGREIDRGTALAVVQRLLPLKSRWSPRAHG